MAKQALILYYSQFDNTAKLASKICSSTGADIVRIKVTTNTFPLDMQKTDKIYQNQLANNHFPKLITTLPDLTYYDLLLVGGPVWDGQVSSPIISLLHHLQGYSGTVAPFSTGWSDTGKYQKDFVSRAGNLNVTTGYHILTHGTPSFSPKTLSSWLRKL
ncbi:flavodoxin [Limosilactobacillus sp. STM2_1]|uniref:Flavodoxin n=1 Tax=Limosilactobacillus rudii TaxID=2759755 RepID=A0A7W3YMM7_9LACO|nr:flavodoxin [Limosilactobacillus rudii]MBB1078697.1 flavodoxin [Limosilactobacillus rudii]MBB1096735.1 flavodoxin [Limosilactobacillus rudii]MCD7135593.1 flavodoxin [Limosilactobacillus rudii]